MSVRAKWQKWPIENRQLPILNSPPAGGGARAPRAQRGSVLVIVLWVAFGLVSLALYFAYSMTFELRAADNRVAAIEAEQAIAGAARYVSNLLGSIQYPGELPDAESYQREDVPVGDAAFWFLGRDTTRAATETPYFALVDEASKLNLNTATLEQLAQLPYLTNNPALAAAIIDWRDSDSTATENGAEDDLYQRLPVPYRCKNGPFESVSELRLVYGMDLETLYGEDTNLNGVLDPNENDGDRSPPNDNRNGVLEPGLLEYLTIWSREPNNTRTNVNDAQALQTLLETAFGADRATQISAALAASAGGPGGGGPGGGGPGTGGTGAGATVQTTNLIEFYLKSGMTLDEFNQIYPSITVSNGAYSEGLVNINTASEAVLACIPGIGYERASAVIAYRQSNAGSVPSVAWLVEALGDPAAALQAGPYVTARSYQFSADIAAVGHHGRGWRRVRYVFDTSDGPARIVAREDLTHFGWALGRDTRIVLLQAGATGDQSQRGTVGQRRGGGFIR